jgi:hypothetical protein
MHRRAKPTALDVGCWWIGSLPRAGRSRWRSREVTMPPHWAGADSTGRLVSTTCRNAADARDA